MGKIQIKFTLDQWLLLAILIFLALLSFIFEYWVAGMPLYTVLVLKAITVLFDSFIAVYYRRFRRIIILKAKRHSLSYYSRETAPFLFVFGIAYALKIGFVSILSIFFPSLALSPSSVKVAIIGMIASTLMFAWLFRILLRKVYKLTRAITQKTEKGSTKSS